MTTGELGVGEHERLLRIAPDRGRLRSDLDATSGLGSLDHDEVVADRLGGGNVLSGTLGNDNRPLELRVVEGCHRTPLSTPPRKLDPVLRQSNTCRPSREAISTQTSMPRRLLPCESSFGE